MASLISLIPGCKPAPREAVEEDITPANTIAIVGNRYITLEELEEEIRKTGGRISPEALLERLIKTEALLHQAEAAGIANDSDVQRRIQAILVGELKKRSLEPNLKSIEISEEEIEKAYIKRNELFFQPELRRLAIIYALDSEGQAQKRVSSAISKADQVPIEKGFGQFALETSNDKRSRFRGGDIGWVKPDQFPSNVPDVLIKEGFQLDSPGDVTEPVRLENGWGTVRLMEIRQEHTKPMDEAVQAQIRSLLMKEKRETITIEFEKNIMEMSKVEIIKPEWLKEIEFRVNTDKKPTQPPSLP